MFNVLKFQLTEHTLSQASQFQVSTIEGILEVLVQGVFLAVHEYRATPVQDPLWGALHHQQVAGIIWVFSLVD